MVNIFRTTIKVKNSDKKIKFTEFRLQKFHAWKAPKNLQNLKSRCIGVLTEQIVFLKKNAYAKILTNNED